MIDIKYHNSLDKAKKLEEAARRIRKESKRFEECDGRIKSQWSGDNANKFSIKMRAIIEDLNRVASQLEQSAEIIRRTAKRIHLADERAAREAMIKNHS